MKTGLVLEGGAFRATYSTGVCDALLEGGIMADYVIGVSAGIAYGVSYVSRQPRRNLEVVTRYAPDRRYMGVNNLRGSGSYFGLDFVYDVVPNELVPFDYDAFAAFPGEVEAVVSNLNTGKADYLAVPRDDRHSVVLQASCAMPLMFPVYEIGGQPYLDGGVTDPIPWKRALEMGCDRVLAVLTRTRAARRKPDKLRGVMQKKYREYPNFLKALERQTDNYNRGREELFQAEREGKLKVIAPQSTLGVGRIERDPDKLRLLWAEGYQMTVERMDELREYFGQPSS